MNADVKKIVQTAKKIYAKVVELIKSAFNTWPKAFIAVVAALIIGYYPLGGRLSERIDKTEDYDFSSISEKQLQSIESIAFLIDREVNQHIWTPNLPFFFPAYSLDNMPNFQIGVIRGIKSVVSGLSKQVNCAEGQKEVAYLSDAARLLAYPENVWLVSPKNKLKMAASSTSQYRKARKKLKGFNQALEEEKCFWVRDGKSLYAINLQVLKGLRIARRQLENEIREGNTTWFDTRADNVFYLNQGRVYAYMLTLKKIGRDYKQVLMADSLYQDWTEVLRALQNGAEINPDIVLNGKTSESFKANHLINLGFYATKAENGLMKINARLKEEVIDAN